MKSVIKLLWVAAFIFISAVGNPTRAETDIEVNPICDDANVFTNVFTQICWDCFLDSLNLFGVGKKPNGANDSALACMCQDALGVPEFGTPMGFWAPVKVNEVVTTPWCSPALGGIRLQDSLTGLGHNQGFRHKNGGSAGAFYQYHYFSYPIMAMLGMLMLPDCSDGYIDMDLLYVSEVDPLWNNDLLSLVLNPESIIFANPAAMAWCATDCVLSTADNQDESFYGCAGCDGSLYPLTGNVFPQSDPVAGSSLITQRVLASLHRKGLAHKTIGDEAMCETTYFPTIPRSQYKFSMLYPVPEASSSTTKGYQVPFIGDPDNEEDVKLNDSNNYAGSVGEEATPFADCCHPMGMSTARWCTPVGGRTRPGKDNAYVYLIWNYRNCCVRSYGG
ncbi:TraU family protein [Rheinheimera hassiensis]|uniref:TraU family protein n=1 Tax=Rheinheimera hassiensis TaxID=1193627 RepID=UPI001F05E612